MTKLDDVTARIEALRARLTAERTEVTPEPAPAPEPAHRVQRPHKLRDFHITRPLGRAWNDTAAHRRSVVTEDRFRSAKADRDYLRRTDYPVTPETFEREERRKAANGERFGNEEAPSGVFCSHRLGAVEKLL